MAIADSRSQLEKTQCILRQVRDLDGERRLPESIGENLMYFEPSPRLGWRTPTPGVGWRKLNVF
ncbi:carboxypeptidase [Sesbania bispinosa]|nr:carboxypeptidase [Sesbania bispinosa]